MEIHCSTVKELVVDLLNDLLNLDLDNSNIFYIRTGLIIINDLKPNLLMEQLCPKILNVDIDELSNNSTLLFDSIFSALGPKSEYIEKTIKDIYSKLSDNNKLAIVKYAKMIQTHCKGYNNLITNSE